MHTKLPLYLALLTLTQCSSCKDGPGPNDQLPPATQEGKNTFGCRVNGQVWLPSRTAYDGFVVLYEPSPTQGGILNLSASRYPTTGVSQTIKLFAGPIFQNRTFHFTLPSSSAEASVSYYDRTRSGPCGEIRSYSASHLTGQLILTRLDEQAGIIAGTFSFTITKPGCDTIRVTDGRFDYKL